MSDTQLLEIKMANDPDAYKFDSIHTAEGDSNEVVETENRFDAQFRSVAAMCGVEIHLRGYVYCKPPKIKQERAMLSAQRKFSDNEPESALDIAIEAALSLLYVREGSALRPAEESDIEDTFDSADLIAILSGAMGVSFTETDEGNA